jgi:hypothetical protein
MLRKALSPVILALTVVAVFTTFLAIPESASATPGICAFKFLDVNGNGVFDEGEDTYLEGWEICITGPVDGCKVTAGAPVPGACWVPLPLGLYEVCVTLQDGVIPTTPPCVEIDLQGTAIVQVEFGCQPEPVPTELESWGKIKSLYR